GKRHHIQLWRDTAGRADRIEGDRDHLIVGVAVLDRAIRFGHRLPRIRERLPGRDRHRNQRHRHRPRRVHHLHIHGSGVQHNSAGQSAQSSQVSATTSSSGGGGGSLPAHLLMGYWQDFTNGATPLTLANVPTSYNLIAVAFGNSDSTPGQVTFGLDSGLSSAL